jgi:hypothetical protein
LWLAQSHLLISRETHAQNRKTEVTI